MMAAAGFTDIRSEQRQPGGIAVSFTARDGAGQLWAIEVAGSFTSHRSGLKKTDILWKALGKAAVLQQGSHTPLLLLTTDLPGPGRPGAKALKRVTGPSKPIHAVIDILRPSALADLQAACADKTDK